jgi:uncharacterized protein YrrD
MIRATELTGRAVVDMDAAEKLGRVDRIIIDPESRRVAAFRLSRGGVFFSNTTHVTVSATSVYAIGPDAITVRHAAESGDANTRFDDLPHVSDVVGRKVVSRDGRLLGVVHDVLISGADGQIVGYELADSDVKTRLTSLFVDQKRPPGSYLRADADLRAGRHLIVAPGNAICRCDDGGDAKEPPASMPDVTSNWFRADLPEGTMEAPK